uniref:(northern house mosquito) hypothetical protein n=1 Tax=Culex pipiens TaxID=7175 RepID=A0A8D8ILK7_CULPI
MTTSLRVTSARKSWKVVTTMFSPMGRAPNCPSHPGRIPFWIVLQSRRPRWNRRRWWPQRNRLRLRTKNQPYRKSRSKPWRLWSRSLHRCRPVPQVVHETHPS